MARLSADAGVSNNGLDIQSNTRSIGHGLFAMMKAYEVLGDKKYLDRANWIVDCVQTWQDGDVEKLRDLNCGVRWDPQFRGRLQPPVVDVRDRAGGGGAGLS